MVVPPLSQPDSRYWSTKEKEEMEFLERLNGMSLGELLEWQRQMKEEAARAGTALHAVREGDLSALAPYIQPQTKGMVMLSAEDTQRERAAIAEGHLRNEKTVWDIKEGRDPAQALKDAKKWLKDAFPALRTEAIVVKDTQERFYIAVLGVSSEEVEAVGRLKSKTKEAAKRTGEIDARIREKISQEPQKTVAAGHEVVAALGTPTQQDKSLLSGGRVVS